MYILKHSTLIWIPALSRLLNLLIVEITEKRTRYLGVAAIISDDTHASGAMSKVDSRKELSVSEVFLFCEPEILPIDARVQEAQGALASPPKDIS